LEDGLAKAGPFCVMVETTTYWCARRDRYVKARE
jgi:hypothetical protein